MNAIYMPTFRLHTDKIVYFFFHIFHYFFFIMYGFHRIFNNVKIAAVLYNARCINCANGSHMCLRFHRIEYSRTDIKQLYTVRRWHGDTKSIYFIGSDTVVLYDGLRNGYGESVKGNAQPTSVYMEMVELATIYRHNDCLHHKR